MKKTILVATDFSPASLNAVNYAADMALAINRDIMLLHIYPIPVISIELSEGISLNKLVRNAETKIEQLKENLIVRSNGKLNVRAEIHPGIFFQELEKVCDRIIPYIVVMGSQGTTATEHILFGSNSVYAMKHLMWPLITVPAEAGFSSIKKIGLACDLMKVTDTIPVDEIDILVHDFNAELHIINLDKQNVFNPKTDYESVILERILAHLHPEYHFMYDRNTDKSITDFVEKNQIDLLIVFPRRKGVLKRLIHRSHTKQLVLHCHVPIMELHNQLT